MFGAAVISFCLSIGFDPCRIGRNGVVARLVSPDYIRFTDFMPGLFMFDPVGILNILNGVCGFRFINSETARVAPAFHRVFSLRPLRLCVTCFIVLPRLGIREGCPFVSSVFSLRAFAPLRDVFHCFATIGQSRG